MKTIFVFIFLFYSVAIDAQIVSKFMVVADMHHYSPAADFSQTITYELCMAAIEEQVDFIFFPGDLIIRSSDDNSSLKDWQFVLDTLSYHNIKVYACRGNNDVNSLEAWNTLFSGDYAFPQNGPEGEKNITYAIVYDNLLFLSLDLYTDYHKINQAWLEDILLATPREHIFAAGHEAAFKISNTCMGNYPEPRNLFWESLTSAGVSAYFCGHDHFYDHVIMDDGDNNPGNDVHQVIVGTGGGGFHGDSEFDSENGRWTPVRIFHEAAIGYVLVEIINDDVKMTWKHRTAQNVFEYAGDSCFFTTQINDLKTTEQEEVFLMLYPNPAWHTTIIKYYLPENSKVKMHVCDLAGKNVTTLVNEIQQLGIHEIVWNAYSIRPGVYFCRLMANGYTQTKKLVVMQ